jgi:hypothetical protein
MTIRNLTEVRARLEKAVAGLPGEPADPAELYDRIEMVATAILDSEFGDFEPGLLEEYLQQTLYLKRLELGQEPYFRE